MSLEHKAQQLMADSQRAERRVSRSGRRRSDKTNCPCGSGQSDVMPYHAPASTEPGHVRRRRCRLCGCEYETVELFRRVVKNPQHVAANRA